MAKRIIKYGLRDEVLEKAKELYQKNFTDECSEWEEVKKLFEKYNKRREVLKKLIGEKRTPKVRLIGGRIAEVKKGQVIELFVHERTQKWVRSKVAEVFEDELGNKYYISEFHLRRHLLRDNLNKLKKAGIATERTVIFFIRKTIKEPQVIIHDTEENAILFGRKSPSGQFVMLPVAGLDSGRIETILVRRTKFQNVKRYKVLYSEVKGW